MYLSHVIRVYRKYSELISQIRGNNTVQHKCIELIELGYIVLLSISNNSECLWKTIKEEGKPTGGARLLCLSSLAACAWGLMWQGAWLFYPQHSIRCDEGGYSSSTGWWKDYGCRNILNSSQYFWAGTAHQTWRRGEGSTAPLRRSGTGCVQSCFVAWVQTGAVQILGNSDLQSSTHHG